MIGPRLDHVALTVPDVEAATAFFRDLLGAELLYDLGPYRITRGNWMAENVGVHPRAVIRTLRLLQLPGGGCIELFEYEGPGSGTSLPRNSEVGGHHAGFRVDDIDAMVERARQLGLDVQGDVKSHDEGPSRGLRWVYFRAPWGTQLEFVSYPDNWPPGMA
ncbi:MAG: VOC family protein [Pseudomonadota bacterium]|nr:VOC family protein [Pseudomonadota bacterium]